MKPLAPATRVRAVEPRRCCGTCPYAIITKGGGFYRCVRPDGPLVEAETGIWRTVCDGWAPFTNARYVAACALMDAIEGGGEGEGDAR